MVIADILMFLIGVLGALEIIELRREQLRMRAVYGAVVVSILFAIWLYQIMVFIHWF